MPPDPASPTEGAASAGADAEAEWRRFQARRQMHNHWERPGWTPDRRSYHWMITLGHSPRLRELAARCQAALRAIPGLDLVPLDHLHLTIRRLAFTDEITPDAFATIAERAANQLTAVESFALVAGPIAGSTGAVRLSVGPHAPIRRIREVVTAVAHLDGQPRRPDFTPHISIAYSNMTRPVTELLPTLTMLRDLPSVSVPVSTVALVELRRPDRAYTWDTLRIHQLGQADLGTAVEGVSQGA